MSEIAHEGRPADSAPESGSSTPLRSLRVWPAVVLLFGLWCLRLVPTMIDEVSFPVMMAQFMGPLICAGLIVLWWLLLSRALWRERLLGLAGLTAIIVATGFLADKSVRGFGTIMDAMPWGITAFTLVVIGVDRLQPSRRTWFALLAALVVFGYWDLVRTDEIRGDFTTKRSWRWEPTAEDRYLATLAARSRDPSETIIDEQQLTDPDWSEFRGPHRDSVQPGITLAEDWQAQPLREVWRVPVGPGWSSFSVAGDLLFTQEQRGDDEAVVCYGANDGGEVWAHQYKSRFWEVVGGPGPRGTPTLSGGNLYALGAEGLLHRLDPITGELVWQRDISQDAGRDPPQWGFSASPLVTQGVVIVHAGGAEDRGVLAYDVESGDLRWGCPSGDHSYSSPHLADFDGVSCVLMLTNQGLSFIDPVDGTLLGEHEWLFEGYRVVQPLVFDNQSVLLGTAMGTGSQRIEVSSSDGSFETQESWTSRGMSPYYNDYVAHNGYLYGFDNNIFACVDLATGKRKWKRGRYGNGQVLLLPEHDQLLVISENGELVLLRATPEKLVELSRHQAIQGRTWNHPVLVHDRLYVRNGEEAACFEVPIVKQ